MTLVRGSTDRLRLDWRTDHGRMVGVAPDGRIYTLQSEHVRGESRVYYYELPSALAEECPYGYMDTQADARRTAEWHAWVVAGRPESG
jgi:hypothetical protein